MGHRRTSNSLKDSLPDIYDGGGVKGGRKLVINSDSWVSSSELLIQQVLEVLRNLQLHKLPTFTTIHLEKRV